MPSVFQLNATTEAVYLNIVENPNLDTTKLSEIVGTSETDVQCCLDRLFEADLVISEEDGTWSAIEPEIGLAGLLARQQADLAQHQQQVEDSRLRAARLLAAHTHRKPNDPAGVELVTGAPAIRSQALERASQCQEEYLSLQPTGRLPNKTVDTASVIDQAALPPGVESRSIVLDSARNDQPTMDYLKSEIGGGAEVRTLPTLPARIRVFDRRFALVSVTNMTGIPGALEVTSEAVVHSFVALFSKLWAEAEPLKECRPRRSGKLSPQEKHILKLWAQGHTDASAARRMDVSLRTVRRLSDRLTERLGACSRFQLGAVAIAQDLIDPADVR